MEQVIVLAGICDRLVGTQEKGTQFEASLGYVTQQVPGYPSSGSEKQ